MRRLGDEADRSCRCLPTALPHLLLVESWPVALAVYLFNKVIVDVNVKVAMRTYAAGPSPSEQFTSYYRSRYTWGRAPATDVLYNNGTAVQLPKITYDNLPGTDKPWIFIAWAFYVTAVSLVLAIVISFRRSVRNPWCTFESGDYLYYAWRLDRQMWYRKVVAVLVIIAVALPAVWLAQCLIYVDRSDEFWDNLGVLFGEWYTGLGLLFSLAKLGAYKVKGVAVKEASRYWHVRSASEAVKRYEFRRSGMPWAFLQHNAGFGSRLQDAVWCALHEDEEKSGGAEEKLRACLAHPDQWKAFLEECCEAQRGESAVRGRALRERRTAAGQDAELTPRSPLSPTPQPVLPTLDMD